MKIINKSNTKVYQETITDKLFIVAQGEVSACAVVASGNEITADTLESMAKEVDAKLVKIVGPKKEYDLISTALNMIFDEKKYVNREGSFDVYFAPTPPVLRAKKSTVSKQTIDNSCPVETSPQNVKVLVVDDSSTICNLLKKIMSLSPQIEVIATVNDPREAEEAIKKYNPDVMTLDIHMPHMNGIELLRKITPKYHLPTIMISSISMQEGPLVLEALESGAVDYIQKPDMSNFANIASEINNKILEASKIEKRKDKTPIFTPTASSSGINLDENLIVIGASTGGTKALKELLDAMPSEIPPVLIVQHIPAEFSKAFADRINQSVPFTVKEAVDGEKVEKNKVLIAPGGMQMRFKNRDNLMTVHLTDDAPVNRFKPSVDYLFDSVADSTCDLHIVSAIFTGMGRDGAQGMKRLKDKKQAITIAQDEDSCVVFGMPKEAIKLGCVDHIVPLEKAAGKILESCVSSLDHKKAQ